MMRCGFQMLGGNPPWLTAWESHIHYSMMHYPFFTGVFHNPPEGDRWEVVPFCENGYLEGFPRTYIVFRGLVVAWSLAFPLFAAVSFHLIVGSR